MSRSVISGYSLTLPPSLTWLHHKQVDRNIFRLWGAVTPGSSRSYPGSRHIQAIGRDWPEDSPSYERKPNEKNQNWTFFYGSYINLSVLKEVELVPDQYEIAKLNGFDIQIQPLVHKRG
jgi:hypothetical protein